MKKYRNDRFEFTVRDIVFMDKTENQWKEDQHGVCIEDIKPGGWAALGNIGVGDLILEVLSVKTDNVKAFEQVMIRIEAEKPKSVVLHVLKGIHHDFVELEPNWDNANAEK
ncbi:MAG: PDZ domain-containing protein [Planctomycetota bacterium]